MRFPKYFLMEEANEEGGTASGTGTDGDGSGKSTTTGTDQGTGTGTGQPTWPGDWRQQFAGNDESAVKRLERFASPAEIYRSYKALEQRVSSGELKAVKPFPEKGTAEEQNAWRTENGIPEAPDKYQLNLGDGIVIGEQDKPIIDDFLKAAHAANLPAKAANAAVKWYFDFSEKQAEARYEQDMQAKEEFEEAMRAEWGQDYKPNLNSIHALLDMAPEGVKDRFLNGRMADGRPLGSDPDTLRWMASLARQINPVTTMVPGSGANVLNSIEDEIGTIEKRMREDRAGYNKDEKQQQRYRDLLAARERHKGRAA